MVSEFLSFVKSNNIAIKTSKTLLAVSGGIDSVVLTHLFSKLGIDFGIAHCNFSLRGNESDEDEKFVKELASSLNVTFHVKNFNTTRFAKSKGISIQMAARELRYSWFEEIRKKFKYDFISTAHHKGDVAETILFNLSKGTGLEGLHGIKAVMNTLVRPLLFASRIEIEGYAQKNNISWREDSSNTSAKYSRNKLRHQVIPILEEINPKAQDSIYVTGEKIKEVELFVKYNLQNLSKEVVKEESDSTYINIASLVQIPGFGYVLSELLKPFGFSYIQSSTIANSLDGTSGKLFYSQSHVVNLDRGNLIVSLVSNKKISGIIQESEYEYIIGDLNITTRAIERKGYSISKSRNILAIDKAKLKFPLEIRTWEIGDVFYPLGMKGKKKLSDFMIDAKIPVNLKNKVCVIISEGDIVGVLEHRLDDRFKITKDTLEVFEIISK